MGNRFFFVFFLMTFAQQEEATDDDAERQRRQEADEAVGGRRLDDGAPPGGAPADLRATPTSSTSLRLTWSAVAKGRWHSHLIGYHVAFRPEKYVDDSWPTCPLGFLSFSNGVFTVSLFFGFLLQSPTIRFCSDSDFTCFTGFYWVS